MDDLILTTDWEKVPINDFYLTDDWKEFNEEQRKELIGLAENNDLYYGYIVGAIAYSIYTQMDSSQVLINSDMDILGHCESAIIDNDMKEVIEYNY